VTRPARRHVPDLRPWIASWGKAWSVPDLAERTTVVFSGRMSRSLGRCALRTGDIRLNAALLDGPEAALLEVACHEAAHAAAFVLHGAKARPHGREWKSLMRAAGYQPVVRWPEHMVPEEVRKRGPSPSSRKAPRIPLCLEEGDGPLSALQRFLRLLR
jgi:hypothetical protein